MKDAVGIILDDLILPLLVIEVVELLDVGIGWIDFHDAISMVEKLKKVKHSLAVCHPIQPDKFCLHVP
jgi:hypothetical protein